MDEKTAVRSLQGLLNEHAAIVFNGDNYSVEWQDAARRRGLFVPVSVPATILHLQDEQIVLLFEKYAILSRQEIEARTSIKIEIYVKTVEMELRVARYLLRAFIIPAALKNQALLLEALRGFPAQVLTAQPALLDNQHAFIAKFTARSNKAMEVLAQLDEDNEKLKEGDDPARARFCSGVIRPHLAEAALLVEKIEERVDRDFWRLPRVTDILFR
jgi:glutamine synthetase